MNTVELFDLAVTPLVRGDEVNTLRVSLGYTKGRGYTLSAFPIQRTDTGFVWNCMTGKSTYAEKASRFSAKRYKELESLLRAGHQVVALVREVLAKEKLVLLPGEAAKVPGLVEQISAEVNAA